MRSRALTHRSPSSRITTESAPTDTSSIDSKRSPGAITRYFGHLLTLRDSKSLITKTPLSPIMAVSLSLLDTLGLSGGKGSAETGSSSSVGIGGGGGTSLLLCRGGGKEIETLF